jgi:hypothetical protein
VKTGERTHLFISYAIEDVTLATWLARKLAALGYAVWFDRLKLLGGEPWPQMIDEAIKTRTFRMIALLSRHSISKPNPSKERTLALRIARDSAIPDFLITLKLDDVDLDWLTGDLTYIAFNNGWADGWRQLVKKLDSIGTPRALPNAPQIAASTFPRGDELLSTDGEKVFANVIRVAHFPKVLRVYSIDALMPQDRREALKTEWPHYRINDLVVCSLIPPPAQVANEVKPTPEQCLWSDCETFHRVPARNIAANLAIKTLDYRLRKAGCREHRKKRGTFYLTSDFSEDGKLHFEGFRGKTWRKIRGRATFWRGAGKKEVNFHHFAFRLRLARGLDKHFYIQLTPSLVFFGEDGKLISDKSVGSRRKRVTAMWWNDEWLNRLLAAQQLLCGLPIGDEQDVRLEPALLTVNATTSLKEDLLGEDSILATPEEEPDVEVHLEPSGDEDDDE